MLVTENNVRQFQDEGYFVLEKVIPDVDLAELRIECQKNLDLQISLMNSVGAETLGLSHKDQRYTLPTRHEESAFMQRFLFGELMAQIVGPLLGLEVYLFLELFSVKCSDGGIAFGWHQDSGYLLGNPHKPYVSLWCALDDMTEENGTLFVLPYSRAESREVRRHAKEKKTNDLIGYDGSDPGIAMYIPPGSIVVLSSTTFHRSSANITDKSRRAFLASYSSEPITDKNGRLWNQAVPFIKNGSPVMAP